MTMKKTGSKCKCGKYVYYNELTDTYHHKRFRNESHRDAYSRKEYGSLRNNAPLVGVSMWVRAEGIYCD
jgi:hypothetical protein